MGRHKHKLIDVADATGLNRSIITKLYNDTATRLDLDTLNKLCALYSCQPGDLLRYEKDEQNILPDAKLAKAERIKAAQAKKQK